MSELPKLKSHGFLKAKEGQCAAVRQQDFSHVVVSVSHAVASPARICTKLAEPHFGHPKWDTNLGLEICQHLGVSTPKNTTPEHTSKFPMSAMLLLRLSKGTHEPCPFGSGSGDVR